MHRILPSLVLLCGCPDYTLKGAAETVAGDSAAPVEDAPPAPEDSGDPADEEDKEDSGDISIEDTGDPAVEEECDGEDNDGDGEIDEGFPDTDGDGIVDCLETSYTIDIALTVDDVWEGWVDGVRIAEEQAGWNILDEYSLTLDSGPHVIAIHGWDTGAAISGHLSTVAIDGVIEHMTGDGSWRVVANVAPEGWQEVGFDDSSWIIPIACIDVSPWSSWLPSILDEGAIWTWYEVEGNCRDPSAYGDAFYRLAFTLP